MSNGLSNVMDQPRIAAVVLAFRKDIRLSAEGPHD